MNYFGIRLRYLRKQDNLTQGELGAALSPPLKKSTISLYENGKRQPDFEIIERFADFFNVNMSTFFPGGEDELASLSGAKHALHTFVDGLTDEEAVRALRVLKAALTEESE